MYPGTWREVGSVTYRAGGKKEGIPAFPTNPTEKKEGQARRSGARASHVAAVAEKNKTT